MGRSASAPPPLKRRRAAASPKGGKSSDGGHSSFPGLLTSRACGALTSAAVYSLLFHAASASRIEGGGVSSSRSNETTRHRAEQDGAAEPVVELLHRVFGASGMRQLPSDSLQLLSFLLRYPWSVPPW